MGPALKPLTGRSVRGRLAAGTKPISNFWSPSEVEPLSPAERLAIPVARLERAALLKVGPQVRIRLPPAESLRTIGSSGLDEVSPAPLPFPINLAIHWGRCVESS